LTNQQSTTNIKEPKSCDSNVSQTDRSCQFLLDEQATLEYGAELAKWLPEQGLVFLNGPLGAGKTTLVRGLLRALGHTGSTKSPTYTIVEPYQLLQSKPLPYRKLYHFDLYRIADAEELEYMGIRDYLSENALCLIEWPEKAAGFLPEADLVISLSYEGEARRIKLTVNNPLWKQPIVVKA
jgi:tRNA threonylcarbamoyladenosine biosynthesis protein TsaE